MVDPHVVSLHYNLIVSDRVTYQNPPAVEADLDQFTVRLAAGELVCKPKAHFDSVDEARGVVEPLLRAWEIDAALRLGRGELSFKFKHADVIDRAPPSSDASAVLNVHSAHHIVLSESVVVRLTSGRYPTPPGDFRVTPDVETLWARYDGMLQGKEPLLSMAYFALTVLQVAAGGRNEAAAALQIDGRVLGKLGELTSQRGDEKTARKMPPSGALTPLTGKEERWIRALLPKLVRRAGETGPVPLIKMSDLPDL